MRSAHFCPHLVIATFLLVALATVPGSGGFFFPCLQHSANFAAAHPGSAAPAKNPKTATAMGPSKRSFFSRLSPLRGGATAAKGAVGASAAARVLFDNAPFWQSQKIFLGINTLGYVLTVTTKSHYHVDLLGTGAFALAAVAPLLVAGGVAAPAVRSLPRVQWSAATVAAWSVKLASFLFYRVLQSGHDSRLDEVLDSPYYAAGFWTFSWMWGALASLPHTVGMTSALPGNPMWLRVGAAVAAAGWTVETLADYQKWKFKAQYPGHFCNAGVWSMSQHPNWFGNLLLWTGVVVMNASALIDPVVAAAAPSSSSQPMWVHWSRQLWRFRRLGLALVSPAFMWYLFSSQATGRLLPEAVQAYKDRYGYGKDPSFTRYVDTTPLIVPRLSGILGAIFGSSSAVGGGTIGPKKAE